MIVARRKPLSEIESFVQNYRHVLIVGCGTCMAVCQTGGEKEVEVLARQLRMRSRLLGQTRKIDEITLPRQCDPEFFDPIKSIVTGYEALVSTACGAGVQLLAECFAQVPVFPATDTLFLGVNEAPGIWGQRCLACGQCILHLTGGICPRTMCAKGILNGPCGGTKYGKCEVDVNKTCAWAAIYDRLEKQGRLELMEQIWEPADWSAVDKPARYSPSLQETSSPAEKSSSAP